MSSRARTVAKTGVEQVEEILAHRLYDVIRRPRLQGGDCDPALVGAGDVDDRRGIGERAQLAQRLQSVHAGHVMIDRDQVEARGRRPDHPLAAALRHRHVITAPCQPARRQSPDTGVVVDIQDAHGGGRGGGVVHQPSISGTWITDRNSPSCRIACAKLS